MTCDSTPIVACTGEPASSPANSPTCHCLARNHSGSRTCACNDRAMLPSRGRGSSLVQVVNEGAGLARAKVANDINGLHGKQVCRDCRSFKIQGEIQRGQDLAHLLDAVKVDSTDLGKL